MFVCQFVFARFVDCNIYFCFCFCYGFCFWEQESRSRNLLTSVNVSPAARRNSRRELKIELAPLKMSCVLVPPASCHLPLPWHLRHLSPVPPQPPPFSVIMSHPRIHSSKRIRSPTSLLPSQQASGHRRVKHRTAPVTIYWIWVAHRQHPRPRHRPQCQCGRHSHRQH